MVSNKMPRLPRGGNVATQLANDFFDQRKKHFPVIPDTSARKLAEALALSHKNVAWCVIERMFSPSPNWEEEVIDGTAYASAGCEFESLSFLKRASLEKSLEEIARDINLEKAKIFVSEQTIPRGDTPPPINPRAQRNRPQESSVTMFTVTLSLPADTREESAEKIQNALNSRAALSNRKNLEDEMFKDASRWRTVGDSRQLTIRVTDYRGGADALFTTTSKLLEDLGLPTARVDLIGNKAKITVTIPSQDFAWETIRASLRRLDQAKTDVLCR